MGNATAPKRRRRSAGEGSVYRGTDGRWRGAVTWTEPDGRRRRRTVSAATGAAARERLDALRAELRIGRLAPAGAGLTVGDYLAGWIERHRGRVRPATWRTAEMYVRVYLIPALGRLTLARLSPADVERALESFVGEGRPIDGRDVRPRRPVSPVTAGHVRKVLRRALRDAVRDGLAARNAASEASPPRVPHRPVTYLTPADVRRLIEATRDDDFGPLWALAATTGLRRGELLALTWPDVADGRLTVRRSVARDGRGGWEATEPKSDRSRRTIPLPGTARAALDVQRERQAAWRNAAGKVWQDRDGRVFTDTIGRPLLPEYVSHRFPKARAAAGIPPVRLHDLRHTAATMMLAEGVPLAVISEWLGHAGIAITASHYAAIVPQLHRQAADAMDRALGVEA
jgi:integrase